MDIYVPGDSCALGDSVPIAPQHEARYSRPVSLLQHDARNALASREREPFSDCSSCRMACASAITLLMVSPPASAPPLSASSASASSGGSPNLSPGFAAIEA